MFPLPPLCSTKSYAYFKDQLRFHLRPRFSAGGESIFLSLILQMGYVYDINGPFLIAVYPDFKLPALSLPWITKLTKIKGNVLFVLHSLHLQQSSFQIIKRIEMKRESLLHYLSKERTRLTVMSKEMSVPRSCIRCLWLHHPKKFASLSISPNS